jgi:hypothetical protein
MLPAVGEAHYWAVAHNAEVVHEPREFPERLGNALTSWGANTPIDWFRALIDIFSGGQF